MEDSMTFHLANQHWHLSLSRPAHPVEGLPAIKRRYIVYLPALKRRQTMEQVLLSLIDLF